MLLFAVGFGVFAHLFFWGAGLAVLAMPRRWRMFWPVVAFPTGVALQSLVVWLGAYANLRGTDRYGWFSELIPLVLVILAFRSAQRGTLREHIARWWGLGLAAGATLAALLAPLARAAKGLTTASLGNCDAADYAAGARVLKEFAHQDRSGFLGLTEVVHIASVNNFFDFWLRLNHFTPSALIALNGTIFHCQPHELTGLMPMAILAGIVPVVFWVARALFGFRTAPSLFLAALYGFSPLSWYAVDQVAIGQLLAAPAIALLTWSAVALWRGRLDAKARWGFFPLLLIAFALIWGGYNFIVVVCLVPAAAYALTRAVWEDRVPRLLPWVLSLLVPLAAAALIFWNRAAGLVERFQLFDLYPFGWRIPTFGPAAWLGLVKDLTLGHFSSELELALTVASLGLLVIALLRAAKRGWGSALLPLALAVPVLFGYAYITGEGLLGPAGPPRDAATYDAFKLFSVFYPLILPAAAFWLTLARAGAPWLRFVTVVCAAAVAAGNLRADAAFARAMSDPPLIVDRDLIGVQKIEHHPEIASVNMRVPEMWERLWANAFLLRRPQYFLTHTYEGRLNTPLRGGWDLMGDLVYVGLPAGDSLQVDPHYAVARVASPYYLRAELGSGWYDRERVPRTSIVWRWTSDDARLEIDNPQHRPLRAVVSFDVTSPGDRRIELWSGTQRLVAARTGATRAVVPLPPVEIPPGHSEWSIRSDQPAFHPGGGDTRSLVFSVFGVRLDVMPDRR